MEEGDIVKFSGEADGDEPEALYRVIEVDGEDLILEFICDLSILPQTTAKIGELELVEKRD